MQVRLADAFLVVEGQLRQDIEPSLIFYKQIGFSLLRSLLQAPKICLELLQSIAMVMLAFLQDSGQIIDPFVVIALPLQAKANRLEYRCEENDFARLPPINLRKLHFVV